MYSCSKTQYIHFSAFLWFFFFLQYDVVGHSGDGLDIELVRCDKVPKNNKQRLNVLKVCSLRMCCVHSLMLFFPLFGNRLPDKFSWNEAILIIMKRGRVCTDRHVSVFDSAVKVHLYSKK